MHVEEGMQPDGLQCSAWTWAQPGGHLKSPEEMEEGMGAVHLAGLPSHACAAWQKGGTVGGGDGGGTVAAACTPLPRSAPAKTHRSSGGRHRRPILATAQD